MLESGLIDPDNTPSVVHPDARLQETSSLGGRYTISTIAIGEWKSAMKAMKKPPFNVNKFLATVDGGRTLTNYGKNQAIFFQGDEADAVFYIREGKVKITVRSDQGK